MDRGFVYILRSVKNNRFYIGSTKNIERRLKEHELGYVKSTKNIRPIKIELYQEYRSFSLARQIERKLKKLKRKDYLEKIVQVGHIDLAPTL